MAFTLIALTLILLMVIFFLINKFSRTLGLSFLFICFILFCFGFYQYTNGKNSPLQAVSESTLDIAEDDSPVALIDLEGQILDVPIISQLPELPRGCEVTALAMLFAHAGVVVDKMELALKIKKDPTSYSEKNGVIYYGHPNNGFIGDMYDRNNRGLGVYHQPIMELAEQYMPGRMIDLTGQEFFVIEQHISKGFPVWVIINTKYNQLPESAFVTWQTPLGPTQITYHEHSAVITGFDEQYVYVNDPLTLEKNKKVKKEEFIKAWVQMGRQAITYSNFSNFRN